EREGAQVRGRLADARGGFVAGLIQRVRQSLPRLSRVLRAFLPRLRPFRWPLLGALLLEAIVAATEVMKPWPLQVVFDMVISPPHATKHHAAHVHGPTTIMQPLLQGYSPEGILIIAAAAILVLSVIGGIADYSETVIMSNVGQTLIAKLRRDLLRHL